MNSSTISISFWQKLLAAFGFALLCYCSFGSVAEAATIVQTGTYSTGSPAPGCALSSGGPSNRIVVSWSGTNLDPSFTSSDVDGTICIGGMWCGGQTPEEWASTDPVATTIPAGAYRVTVQTYDVNETRDTSTPQPQEVMSIHLFSNSSGSGSSFAVTDQTDDLNDTYELISQTDVVENSFNITQTAQSIRGINAATISSQSVRLRCVAFDPIDAPSVTLTPSTPGPVVPGTPVPLTWTTENVTSCTASGGAGWTGSKNANGGSQSVTVNANTTYSLTCTGPGGTTSDPAVVTVSSPTPTVNLTANPPSVVLGTPVTLSWTSTNANTCTASDDWSGQKTPVAAGSSEVTESAARTYRYTLTCSNGSVSNSDYVDVVVTNPSPSAPTVNLTATPATIDAGDPPPKLTWTSTNATNCTSGPGWSGSGTSNTVGVTVNPAVTTSYTITCTGPGGSTPDSATVTVNVPPPPPEVDLDINDPVPDDDEIPLVWDTENVDNCRLTGGSLNQSVPTDGSQSVYPDSDTMYTLTCEDEEGNDVPDSVFVEVFDPNDYVDTMKLTAEPPVVRKEKTTILIWEADPSLSCHIEANGTPLPDTLAGGSGSIESPELESETVFELVCDDVTVPTPDASVRVRVIPIIMES